VPFKSKHYTYMVTCVCVCVREREREIMSVLSSLVLRGFLYFYIQSSKALRYDHSKKLLFLNLGSKHVMYVTFKRLFTIFLILKHRRHLHYFPGMLP
jgi:hypothetical protein